MIHVHLDFETKARRDLPTVGARKYSQCPEFGVVWVSVARDDEPVLTLDTYYEAYPGQMLMQYAPWLLDMFRSKVVGEFIIWAWNAPFEMRAIEAYYGIELCPENWRCAMVYAGYLGLPRKLGEAAKVLQLETLKDAEGNKHIAMFSCPQAKPTKKYGFSEWVTPLHEPVKWQDYGRYNNQDVVVERGVLRWCMQFPGPSATEWLYWRQNEIVNARGMQVDVPFAKACIAICAEYLKEITEALYQLTGLTNQSDDSIKKWITSQGINMPSLSKDYLADNINMELLPYDIAECIKLRGAKSKTSISKFYTMLDMLIDGRIYDQIQHYGADTGRFAGRGVQPHNLPKTFSNENMIKRNAKRLGVPLASIEAHVGNALETAKDAILSGAGALCYRDVTAIVGKMQRPAIIAREGHLLVPCDYSSIEAIMLAWVAGEEWMLEAFRARKDIYKVTAARMYNVAEEDVTDEQRDKGKRATLALGYQGWVGAMITSGALRAGMLESELPLVCRGWRDAAPAIAAPAKLWRKGSQVDNPSPGLWAKVEYAARYAVLTGDATQLVLPYCTIGFSYEQGNMFITLPSGRRLSYHKAHVVNGDTLRYYGMKTIKGTTKKIWGAIDLYGGLITENIIQAMARDCLVWVMDIFHGHGLPIVVHVHDEVVAEVPEAVAQETLDYMHYYMAQTPPWANGLPLKAKGFVTPFYCKE